MEMLACRSSGRQDQQPPHLYLHTLWPSAKLLLPALFPALPPTLRRTQGREDQLAPTRDEVIQSQAVELESSRMGKRTDPSCGREELSFRRKRLMESWLQCGGSSLQTMSLFLLVRTKDAPWLSFLLVALG